uniref:Uncharacterized protein n=1 Tax=Amphimedon queenslandica TaxID=400682 RepID=A0A1X7TII4_AMPQE
MDLAKERYGGCFSHEEVENFKNGSKDNAREAIRFLGLGLAYILIILSIVSLFLIDLIGRLVADNNSDVPCFFMWKSVNQTIDISYWILVIPSVLAGTSYFLTKICLFEFLCSQSPFGMHGMIIGLHWFYNGIFTDFAIAIRVRCIDVKAHLRSLGQLQKAQPLVKQHLVYAVQTTCFTKKVRHRFEHIPISNPYKIVFKVLKFSLTTSRTRRQHRSAFTYWGEEPSRMDLAKERYGGCFSHEEVENVKTFLRIAIVFATVFSLFVSAFPIVFQLFHFTVQFKDGSEENASNAVWVFGNVVPLFVLVPLFELVILPFFPKLEYFIINPLKGLGLAYILIILSIFSLFLIDLIGRITSSITCTFKMPCFFMWKSVNQTINFSYWILLIPSVLAGTSYFLTWIYSFEFLCSQSPFARWYVNRVRDTDLGLRAAVEEHWENRLLLESGTNDTGTRDVVISS